MIDPITKCENNINSLERLIEEKEAEYKEKYAVVKDFTAPQGVYNTFVEFNKKYKIEIRKLRKDLVKEKEKLQKL